MNALRGSRVLQDIRRGGVALCFKINFSDPRVIEICGLAGLSAVWLCNEHVPNDWLNIEHQVRSARLYDMDVIVRVAKGSYSEYIRPFECDAAGIMVPHVASAEEARQIVSWTRFPPLGRRAIDGGNVDARFCSLPVKDYISHANRERFIILQIESPEAVEKAEEIAAVPGFDMLLFGPGDYSCLIGKPGEIHHPEVLEARTRVEAAAKAHGKGVFGVGVVGDERDLRDRGYSLVSIGSDVVSLSQAVTQAVTRMRGESTGASTSIYASSR